LTYRFEEEISKFGLEFANKLSVANVSMTNGIGHVVTLDL
jgi:hypothetical protein